MMVESSYDNSAAGVRNGTKVGAKQTMQMLWKQVSKLKKIARRNRRATPLEVSLVLGAKGSPKASQMVSKMES